MKIALEQKIGTVGFPLEDDLVALGTFGIGFDEFEYSSLLLVATSGSRIVELEASADYDDLVADAKTGTVGLAAELFPCGAFEVFWVLILAPETINEFRWAWRQGEEIVGTKDL